MLSLIGLRTPEQRAWGIECNPRLTSGIHFYDPESLVQCLGGSAPSRSTLRTAPARWQWAYSVLTEAYRYIFQPRRFFAHLKTLFSARDVVWDMADPLPFLLMTPLSWEILWPAMTTGISLGEASQRDIAALWQSPSALPNKQDSQ